jgi:23S rRNA pseudouridine1911/1915/1917 synthase
MDGSWQPYQKYPSGGNEHVTMNEQESGAETGSASGGPAAGVRLDTRVMRDVPALSRDQARRLIRQGRVRVNGQQARGRPLVALSDRIEVDAPEPSPPELEPRAIPFEVLHEDADLIVVNKPAGLPMHPIGRRFTLTLANALLHRCPDMVIANERRPGLVHRLDRDTSGVVVAAKNARALAILARQFQRREVRKEYLALAWGWLEPPSGTVEAPLASDPDRPGRMVVAPAGKRAVTHYETVERLEGMTLLRMRLETGRTHQIRVHLAHLGHPLVGDWRYGARDLCERPAGAVRQMLHAHRLVIRHPATNAFVEFVAALPADFEQLAASRRCATVQGCDGAPGGAGTPMPLRGGWAGGAGVLE